MIQLEQNLINDLEGRHQALSSGDVAKLMKQGLKDLISSGLPDKKLEHWKYTSIAKALPTSFKLPESDDTHPLFKYPEAHQIKIVNGQLKSHDDIPGVKIHLIDPERDHHSAKIVRENRDGSHHLHWAALQQIILITVEANTILEHPIVIHHLFTEKSKNTLSSYRLLIEAKRHSEFSVIEMISGENTQDAWTLLKTDIRQESASRVNHINIISDFNSGFARHDLKAELARDAYLNSFSMNVASELVRRDIGVDLNEENATAHVNGLFAIKSNQHSDTDCVINHYSAHTFSDQLYKGVASDKGHGIFTGKIVVHRDAQKVDSSQLSNNLLLSKLAHIDARPQLEVYADDVKCAHGATIGQLSEDELFYLESRGIEKETASNILANAFVQEAIDKAGNQTTCKLINEFFKKRFDVTARGEA